MRRCTQLLCRGLMPYLAQGEVHARGGAQPVLQQVLQHGFASAATVASTSRKEGAGPSPRQPKESMVGRQGASYGSFMPPSYQGKFVLKIEPYKAPGSTMSHVITSDVLNFLEDPSLSRADVLPVYNRSNFRPLAFCVLYDSQERRDTAAAAAGRSGRSMLGTVPVQLSAGSTADLLAAWDSAHLLRFSSRRSSDPSQANSRRPHHSQRVALLTTDEPLRDSKLVDKQAVQEAVAAAERHIADVFLQGFDLIPPYVRVLSGGQRSSVGGEKASRALVFFANPEEAYRASNTLHNKVLREKPARLHVIT